MKLSSIYLFPSMNFISNDESKEYCLLSGCWFRLGILDGEIDSSDSYLMIVADFLLNKQRLNSEQNSCTVRMLVEGVFGISTAMRN